jgi:hypothetical protein
MDSAEISLYPITSRNIGNPVSPVWSGTISELDQKFATLGISKNVCFLIDPAGANNISNTQCDGTVPAAYGAVSGQSKENTKIIPDGYLTPGSHVEYFLRRTTLENPGTVVMLFDTNAVFPQDPGGNIDTDAERWSNFDVEPDMWKSTRYGGAGLACMLMIDGNDRRGADRVFRGAADSRLRQEQRPAGWKGLGPARLRSPAGSSPRPGPVRPEPHHYDICASESAKPSRASFRLEPRLDRSRAKSGPSASMLARSYTTVLHLPVT